MLQSVAAHGWWHIDCDAVAYDWKDELREQPQWIADNAIDDMEHWRAERRRQRDRALPQLAGPDTGSDQRSSSTMHTRRATRSSP